jgi:eukaryotic-like serine/threonine-protein kinase
MQDRGADEAFGSTVELGQQPEPDPLAMERARARVERGLFGAAEPAKLGRYEILEPIAGGGMGMVYSARDPELGRKVALKVLHPLRARDSRSRQRLHVEARALAKLDHPNVVKIHDVIDDGGQVVIVMELVEGETLAAWEQHAQRSWREIIGVYAQAAAGLAAAHGVDVVHRDFKPSNAIIGSDGRVRVLDFGLARLAASGANRANREDDAVPPAGEAGPELTASGDVVGTLAYSAPEQLDGGEVTAASDQFSLCVSLHRAVEGVMPFQGTTPDARLAGIRDGVPARGEDARRVPPWLRQLILRGLAVDPSRRYASMSELLVELRRPRGWQRWRLLVLAVAIMTVSTAVTAAVRGPSDEEACDGGAAQLAAVWNAAQRNRVLRAIDSILGPDGAPVAYAREVRGRLLSTLDGYATEWNATHRAACRSHRRGAVTTPQYGRQATCLEQRRGDLRVAIDVLAETDRTSLTKAIDVAAKIPPVAFCADLERLEAEVPPPDTLEARQEIARVRTAISVADALAHGGRTEAALASAQRAVSAAKRTDYVPVQVEAGLAEGRIRLAQMDIDGAIAVLAPVRAAALEQHMLAAAVEASARLIWLESRRSVKLENLEHELAYVLPLSAAVRGDKFARPLLLNNIGTAYMAAGRRKDALRYFELAKNEVRRNDPKSLELTCIDLNLGMVTLDPPTRETLFKRTWERLQESLGESHIETLNALVVYAQHVMDPQRGLDSMSSALDRYLQFHPGLQRQIAHAATRRAWLARDLDDATRTVAAYELAIDKTTGVAEDMPEWHAIVTAELALLRGDPARAVHELTPVYTARLTSQNWWDRAVALRAAVGLGQGEARLGHDKAAARILETAIAGYREVTSHSEEVEHRRYLARAQRALADLLRGTGEDAARVAALEDEVRSFYLSASPAAYRWLLPPRTGNAGDGNGDR